MCPEKCISLSLILVTHTYHQGHTIAPGRTPHHRATLTAGRLRISGRLQPENHRNFMLKFGISFAQRFELLESYLWILFDTSRRGINLIILHEVDHHHDSWPIPTRSKCKKETWCESQVLLSPMGQSQETPEHKQLLTGNPFSLETMPF